MAFLFVVFPYKAKRQCLSPTKPLQNIGEFGAKNILQTVIQLTIS